MTSASGIVPKSRSIAQPAAERTGDDGGERARAGNERRGRVVAVARDRRRARRRAPARRARRGSPRATGQRIAGRSPPGPFRCGSTTCSVRPGGDGGVEGVAALLEHGHAGRRGEPVRRGDHAEGAAQLGARREHARTIVDRVRPLGGRAGRCVRIGHGDRCGALASAKRVTSSSVKRGVRAGYAIIR